MPRSPRKRRSLIPVTAKVVVIQWTQVADTDRHHYNVYRGTVAGGSKTRINSADVLTAYYADTSGLAPGTYYYAATAVDAAGNESAYSTEAQAVVDTGTVLVRVSLVGAIGVSGEK